MSWYESIFSEKKSLRLSRHLIFWMVWWVYFTITYFHYEQVGVEKVQLEIWSPHFLIKSFLLLSIQIIACYFFINVLLPKYLFKRKYAQLIAPIMAMVFLILMINYFFHKTIFPFINVRLGYVPEISTNNIWWSSIVSGLLSAPKVISAAVVIILLKRWHLKQKEKEKLEREKLTNDLLLLKAQMHPEFLFASLNNITRLTEARNTNKASSLLLRFSNILSYMLYDCTYQSVPLELELDIIRDYLILEKSRMDDKLELDFAIKGSPSGKSIIPLILLSFIEDCFFYLRKNELETRWMNLEFQIEGNECSMKLIYGKPNDPLSELPEVDSASSCRKQLDFFYPDNYELKITAEPEITMKFLKINLIANKEKSDLSNFGQFTYATA